MSDGGKANGEGGGLKAAVASLFETSDLYAVIGAEKSASESELKRAYHKKSLLHHPDRPGGNKASWTLHSSRHYSLVISCNYRQTFQNQTSLI